MIPLSRRMWQIGILTGGLTVLGYLACSIVAYLLYPSPYGPTANWLSDLGDYSANPTGAMVYDAGVFLTGIMIAGFSLSHVVWGTGLARKGRVLLTVGSVSGVAAGVSLSLTGVFPLPTPVHGTLGMVFQINMGDLIVFSTVALLRHARYPRPIAFVAFAAAAADLNFSVFNNTPIFEWLDIALLLAWAALMTFGFWKNWRIAKDLVPGSRTSSATT